MKRGELLLIAGVLAALLALSILNLKRIERIDMNIDELQAAIGDLGAQLTKALDEITRQIATLGTVPQAVVDALDNAKSVAQALDDLNPDTP